MSVGPVFVQDKKSTTRELLTPAIGVDGEIEGLNRYRYFKAGQAIQVGEWVSLQFADMRSVLIASSAVGGLNMPIGVAMDAATTAEAAAGKLIRVQTQGTNANAFVQTVGGSAGYWACLGTTPGICDPVNPATVPADAAAAGAFTRQLGDRVGLLMEASSGSRASVLIIPRLP